MLRENVTTIELKQIFGKSSWKVWRLFFKISSLQKLGSAKNDKFLFCKITLIGSVIHKRSSHAWKNTLSMCLLLVVFCKSSLSLALTLLRKLKTLVFDILNVQEVFDMWKYFSPIIPLCGCSFLLKTIKLELSGSILSGKSKIIS